MLERHQRPTPQDALQARVADYQRQRLARRQPPRMERAPSRWSYVPIAALLAAAGNLVIERANGTAVSGHEPVHDSESGTCLVVWPSEGRWWCSSCRQGGDGVALVMGLYGWPYARARVWLGERFGFPPRSEAPHA